MLIYQRVPTPHVGSPKLDAQINQSFSGLDLSRSVQIYTIILHHLPSFLTCCPFVLGPQLVTPANHNVF